MLCLTTSKVVEALVYGEDGILAGIKEGAVLIDFGTSIPASTRKIGADLAAKGAGMIDAPLGRTPAHAKDGLLNIMASGDAETFAKVKPILEMQGENVFNLGALGSGHTTKLINNFMGMTTVAAMSQAFAVAEGYVHAHRHSQVSHVVEGEFHVNVDGVIKILKAGDSFFVPPHVDHGAVCPTGVILIDVFSPPREDFVEGLDAPV